MINHQSHMQIFKLFFLLLFLFFMIINLGAQPLYINEFMSSNATYMADEDGDYEDWLEIYNADTVAINLMGYGLTDDSLNPYKWVFPDVSIQPGGILLVWASGKNRSVAGMPLHTSWRISRTGEALMLTDTNGVIVDYIPPVYLLTDISYGRYPNGHSMFYYFDQPTAGTSNLYPGFEELLTSLPLSHEPGFYTDSFYLKITPTDTNSMVIYYTMDGSVPTTNSAVFPDSLLIYDRAHEPDQISAIPTTFPTASPSFRWYPPMDTVFKGTNIRFKVLKANALSPKIFTKTFWVSPDMDTRYDIPVISISMEESALFGNSGIYTHFNARGIYWERDAHMEFFEPDGQLGFSTDMGVRIHGGNSRRYALKSFRLYFRNQYGKSGIDYPIFPQNPDITHERLILRAGGSDWHKAFYRDAFVQSIIEPFSDVATQSYRPSIVFLNGEYWGIMNIRERYDNNYIENNYGYTDIDMLYRHGLVEYGNSVHYNALLNFFNTQSLDDSINYAYVKTQMDVENFRDYHILQIFSMNTDQPGKNVRYWRPQTAYGKWQWLLYDLDDSFVFGPHNNYYRNGLVFCIGLDSLSDPHVNMASPPPSWAPNGPTQTFPLRALIVGSSEFRTDFISRFADLLNTAFRTERLHFLIDSFHNGIDDYLYEHYRRWHRPTPAMYNTHINHLYNFSEKRAHYMRQHILSFFELPNDTFMLQLDVSDTTHGFIQVNTVEIAKDAPGFFKNPYPWEGVYFKDIPVEITAHAELGYIFSHWIGAGSQDSTWATIKSYYHTDTVALTAVFIKDPLWGSDSTAIHYWHFNDLPSGKLRNVFADSSRAGLGHIQYTGDSDGYMDAVNAGTILNVHFDADEGKGLRVRNPSHNRTLEFALPTVGFKDIKFRYAVYRTNNGAQNQLVQYKTGPESNWININDTITITQEYQLHLIDFSHIEEVNNNPFFKIRILFCGVNADTTSGNNRFDNISLSGVPYHCSKQLIHYFHFNNLPEDTITNVYADESLTLTPASITYPGFGNGYMDKVSNGTLLNTHNNEESGYGLRVRNPSHVRSLIISLPTEGVFDVGFSYAVRRTTNGAQNQTLYYRNDSLSPWLLIEDSIPVLEEYQVFNYCFEAIEEASNNPNFQVRIDFTGINANATSGNNRFDNILLYGSKIMVDTITDSFCLGSSYDYYGKELKEAGYYTHIFQDNNGCDSLALVLDLEIYEINSYLFETICDDYYIFNGDTITLSGIYTDTLQTINGCDSVLYLNLEIIEIDTTVIFYNNGLLAVDSNANFYQWLDCDNGFHLIGGANDQFFLPEHNGSYAVHIVKDSCFAISDCHNFTSSSVLSKDLRQHFNVYPTLSDGYFTIYYSADAIQNIKIRILNSIGQVVYKKALGRTKSFKKNVNLSDQAAGTYMVHITFNDQTHTKKIIIAP